MYKRIIIVIALSIFFVTTAHAAVKLKIAVVNPSQEQEQTTDIRYDLPKGVDPNSIIDIGDMELGYDLNKEVYYVHQIITLKPAENKILEIKLEDLWVIPEKDITFLKNHTGELLKKLKKTKHFEIGSELAEKITEELDVVGKGQSDITLNQTKKIDMYYENIGIIKEIKENIGKLENLVLDVGGIVEERVLVPTTLVVSVSGEESAGTKDIIELKVKITNPSQKAKQISALKYDLLQEVTPRYIIDSAGLDVGYNFNKACFRVFKDDIELQPAETKIFVVKLKDIWRIPQVDIDALRSHTNNLMSLLKGSDYFSQGESIADKVLLSLGSIEKTQALKVEADEHIGYHRSNLITLEDVKKQVARLEKLVSQSGTTPGITVVKAERLKGGTELHRKRGYEGIRLIAETIFRGKAPTPATTWKIIFVILGFIGLLGGFFFWLWYSQVKRQKTEDRSQMTEDRSQMTEDRSQRTEGRGQKSEDRGQMTDDRSQRTEGRGQMTEDRND